MSASCEQESCEQGITLSGDLHARPAGALAVAAGRFASAVSVTAGGQTADAKSVLGVMGLGATSGQHVTVSAAGPDAQEAVAALIAILGEATKVGGLLRHLAGVDDPACGKSSLSPAAHPGRPRKPDISRAPWFVRENNFYPERTVLRAPPSRLAIIVLMGDKRGKPCTVQVSWYFTARVARMGTHAPTTAACSEGHGSAAHLDHDRSRAGCRHCCYGDFDRA